MNEVEDGIHNSEVIIIPKVKNSSLRTYAWNALLIAAKSSKEILCFMTLSDSEKELVQQISASNNILKFFDISKDIIVEKSDVLHLNRFNIPVFYVSESIPDCDGYEIFLKLALQLQKSGKRVLAVSEDSYNQLFEFEFVRFGAKLEVKDQILRINQIIYDLTSKQNPDVILIRLPEPMMQYNDSNLFDCGSMAFLISQAIPADGCIFCTPAHTFFGEVWEKLSELINSKFGCPIIGVHVSNQFIDTTVASLLSLHIPMYQVHNEIELLKENSSLNFYSLLWDTDFDIFFKELNIQYLNLPYGVI